MLALKPLLLLPVRTWPSIIFTRTRTRLAPIKTVNVKRHKGRIPIPIGGSTKGTTLAFGEWGIRIKGNGVRFSAQQLLAAEEVLKRKIKPIKGSKIWLRIFTDIPVCIKVRCLCRTLSPALFLIMLGKRNAHG